jgi:hypothetical protein
VKELESVQLGWTVEYEGVAGDETGEAGISRSCNSILRCLDLVLRVVRCF